MIGSTLRVRYEITSQLASTPLFTVYGARDRVLNSDVSVRILNPPFDQEIAFVKRLNEVVEQWVGLSHPNLQRLMNVDSDESRQFLVGEVAKGTNLLDRIKKLAPFTAPTSIAIAIGICEGLAAIHEAGKVHGDVGAHNVNVGPSQEVQLELGGLWECYGASETAGVALLPSMAPYLAPEVSAGEMPSARSDVYGVGVVLYELLTGRLPYTGDKPLATAMRHATQPTPSVREANHAIPVVLDEIIKKAMAKDPAQRYPNAGLMLSDLRVLQDAMRFGRSLSWPLGGAAPSPEPGAATVAPKMSAVRDESKTRTREQVDLEDRDSGDVPTWMKMVIAFLMGTLAIMVLGYVVFNMRKPRMANVPELRRLSVAEATTRLSALNLKLKVVQRRASEDIPADQIMETSPAANEKVYENSEVTAVVSAGSRFVEIPDIRGLNMDKAKMLLGSVGLELDPVADKQRVSDADPGMIVSSEPEWGKRVERGTRVRVTVAAERSEKNSSKLGEKFLYSVKIICKGIQAPVVVRVEITDEQGTRTVHEESHDPDEEFTVETEGFGKKATFSIYYDNELVKQFEQNAEEEPTP